jgi:hypothetical protein
VIVRLADHVEVSARVERKQPDLPRYAVIPSAVLAAWNLDGTTTVDVTIDGRSVDRRTVKRWDAQRWFLSITDADCRSLGIDTGSEVRIQLHLASTELPDELKNLLEADVAAKAAWDLLTPSQQRMLRDEIASRSPKLCSAPNPAAGPTPSRSARRRSLPGEGSAGVW